MPIRDILLPLVGEPSVAATAAIDKCMAVAGDIGARVSAVAVEQDILVRPKVTISDDLDNTAAAEVAVVAVAKFQGALEGGEGRVQQPEHGVGAGQVVPGDRAVGQEPDESAVHLERPAVKALGGEVVGVDPERVGASLTARSSTENSSMTTGFGLCKDESGELAFLIRWPRSC